MTRSDNGALETQRWLDGDALFYTESFVQDGQPATTCTRVFRWTASDPIWGGGASEAHVLLSRPVDDQDEEVDYDDDGVAQPPLPPIREVSKAGAAKAPATQSSSGMSLVNALSSSLTDSWSALETLISDKPPGGQKDWHSFFGIDRKQQLLGAFNCGMQADSTVQGRLYVFDQAIGFYSSFVGSTVRVIRASDMTDVAKVSVGMAAGLEVRTMSTGSVVFTNFLSRDQAYDLVHKVMWSFADATDTPRPAPIALGFSGERYLFVRVNTARPSSGVNPLKSGIRDCFVQLTAGQYEIRTLTVENSSAPAFDTVCVFPCSVLDPGNDCLSVTLSNEAMSGQNQVMGERLISLAGTPAAPTQTWLRSSWRAPNVWHKLEMAEGPDKQPLPQAEVSLSVWTASSSDPFFRTARTAVRKPANKFAGGDFLRCKTYEEPRLAYLFLHVRKATGLKARHGKPNGMADPLVHISVGGGIAQRARTKVVQDTLSPVWDDSFTFVVEKPLSGNCVLELYDGEANNGAYIGEVSVPVQDIPLRSSGSRAVPAPRWYRISRKRDRDSVASRVLSGDMSALGSLLTGGGDDSRDHLGELELLAYLDSDYLPQEADNPAVGHLCVEVVRTRQLAKQGEHFAVAHYGRCWARLPNVPSADGEWRQELLLPVRDMGDVLAVGVFRASGSTLLSQAKDEFIGKACVRPGTLLPGRAYKRSVPLVLGHRDGVVQTGLLDMSVTFVRYSAAATLGRYLQLPLPAKCYMEPPAESTADALPEWEEALVEAHLGSVQPPLSPDVQRAMRPLYDPRLSMRLLRVHLGRLLARFLSDRSAGPSVVDPVQWWSQPLLMVLVHVVFCFLVFNPELLLPLLLTAIAAWGFSSSRPAPLVGPDPWLSTGGQFAEATALLRGPPPEGEDARKKAGLLSPPASSLALAGDADEDAATAGIEWCGIGLNLNQGQALVISEKPGDGDAANSQQLDVLFDGVLEDASVGHGTNRQLSAEKQKQLFRALALYTRAAQDMADKYATRLEKVAGVFSWREPLVSRAVFTALLLSALALFFIPLRSVVLAAGLYAMRHPSLRSHNPTSLTSAWMRLASLKDHVV